MRKINYRLYSEIKNGLLEEICNKCGRADRILSGMESVLLFEEKQNIHIGAYVKNDKREFCFPVYEEWEQSIFGVDSFKIYIKNSLYFEPIGNGAYIFERDDLTDFYIVFMRTDIQNQKHFLELYHGTELVFSKQTANICFNYGVDLKLIYTTFESNKYIHWIYKEDKHIPLLESNDMYFSKSKYEQSHRERTDIISGDYAELYFHYVNCKRFYIAEHFAKTYGDEFELLTRQFEDDDTYNYRVIFQKDRVADISFMNYCMEDGIGGYAVYGFPVSELKKNCFRDKREKCEYALWLELNSLWEHIDAEYQCREVLDHICKIKKLENGFHDIPQLKYFDKIGSAQSLGVLEYLQSHKERASDIRYPDYKKRYNEIYENLVNEGKIDIRWKSEYDLYKLVKKMYPDAIYQFRVQWLGLQSLDIYIPSLQLGIEYQGIQHYNPISLFGGEEGFVHRKHLDKIKQELCMNNNVRLLYWRYDEKINNVLLKRKIEEISK